MLSKLYIEYNNASNSSNTSVFSIFDFTAIRSNFVPSSFSVETSSRVQFNRSRFFFVSRKTGIQFTKSIRSRSSFGARSYDAVHRNHTGQNGIARSFVEWELWRPINYAGRFQATKCQGSISMEF